MSNILERIVSTKRQEIAAAKAKVPERDLEELLATAPPVRAFRQSLEKGHGLGIIAEVKKASPSAGILRDPFDPLEIARIYEAGGAHAISVLTDEPFFQGKLAYLTSIRQVVGIPVLRKDFILDSYQVIEARVAGADAVLLIAEILEGKQLPLLLHKVEELGMHALVELYDPENLARVVDSGARIIGVNNRNLRTFATKLEHTLDLLPDMPKDACVVSESGIRNRVDMNRLQAAGVKAVLIGETFMKAPDIAGKLREMRGFPVQAP